MDSCENKDKNDTVHEDETEEEDITTNVRKAHSFRGGMDSTFIL